MTEEYIIEAAAGKFPKVAFSGIFKGYEFLENKNGTKVLRLNFDEDTVVDIYGRGKLTADGKAPATLGKYIESLRALGIESFATQEDGELLSLRHEPDIVGSKMRIEPVIEKGSVGDTAQEDSSWWGIVTKIEGAQPAKKPGKYPPKPKTPKEQPPPAQVNSELSDALLEADVLGMNISEVFNETFKKKYRVPELRAALVAVGLTVAQNGIIQKVVV